MWISFNDLPASARIWIYQADRELDDTTSRQILNSVQHFIAHWEAHGQPLKGSAEIRHGRFLVIGLDESYNAVTGCSTDASVNAIKEIGRNFEIDFFNRTQLPFLVGDRIEVLPLEKVRRKEIPSGVSSETLTFNNLIQEKSQLESSWMQPVGETWLARYVS